MIQAPFKQRIYSLVLEHTLNPDSTPCVGRRAKKKSQWSFISSKIPESTHLSKLSSTLDWHVRAKQTHPTTYPNKQMLAPFRRQGFKISQEKKSSKGSKTNRINTIFSASLARPSCEYWSKFATPQIHSNSAFWYGLKKLIIIVNHANSV